MAEEKEFELKELDDTSAAAAESPAEGADGNEGEGEGGDEASSPPAPATDARGLPEVGDLPRSAKDLEAVYDIPVQVSAVLGKTTMQVSQLLKLGRGAVIELDRKVGEAIDIYVNNRLVARGEVVVVDERLGVTMTEIIKTETTA
ncbi:MAG: flagellar motor switch protein FliN [Proteobacteria bacterium]|nr:flagellar motor switch protein FliN [Pseudomonadota bacterium]